MRFVAKWQPSETRADVGGWIVGDRWHGVVVGRYAGLAEAEAEAGEANESLDRARVILGEVA